jgi:hypothetical protein
VQASAQTANTPRYPDEGALPNLGTIPSDGIILCFGMSQANYECGGSPPGGAGGWQSISTVPIPVVNGARSGWDTRDITEQPTFIGVKSSSRFAKPGIPTPTWC